MSGIPTPPAPARRLDGPDGKPSAGRLMFLMAVIAGIACMLGGLALAFLEAKWKTGTSQGTTIALAGLGAVFSGAGGKAWQAQAENSGTG